MDEISMEEIQPSAGLKYLPSRQPVNIEFQDLVYSVPDINGNHQIRANFRFVFVVHLPWLLIKFEVLFKNVFCRQKNYNFLQQFCR